jgi:ABC-type Fe3+-citrate transport system substrate-binding protein
MKNLLLTLIILFSLKTYAQKIEKDLKYFYYYADQDKDFEAYLIAKKDFDLKKFDFNLPKSAQAIKELDSDEQKIFKNQKTYAAFLTKYGMTNGDAYAQLWFKQIQSLKLFAKNNPEFFKLSPKQRQSIIDKWYYSIGTKE